MRSRYRWSQEDLMLLEELIDQGMSDATIGRRLGCSANAVNITRKRHGIAPRRVALMTSRTVQKRLGLSCAKTVAWWITEGWLKARRGQRVGKNRMWYITEDALQSFLEDSAFWHLWEPARMPDRDERQWAQGLRRESFLTTRQVGQRYSVQHATVNDWIHRGLLPAVRHGNWLVRERDLAGFVPPCERERGGYSSRRFNRQEDHQVLLLRSQGWTWQAIADTLDRALGSVVGRYSRLIALEDQAVAS